MSCGRPHETDCREVIEAVYLYLDGEHLDDAGRHRITVHLDECSPCLRQYGIEHEVKALVARSCAGEAAPDGLRARVLSRLQQARVEFGTMEFQPE